MQIPMIVIENMISNNVMPFLLLYFDMVADILIKTDQGFIKNN